MQKQILAQTKAKMDAAIEHLKEELKNIRTGRANPGMLDSVNVDISGTQMRIKSLASITAPEPRMLLITPFDRTTTSTIGKAIERANIGLMPIVDGNVIRIKIAQMDDNVRKEMIKLCHKRAEESKVTIRGIRREGNEFAKKQKKDGNLAEDVLNSLEKNIQKITDEACDNIDILAKNKEKEISTI